MSETRPRCDNCGERTSSRVKHERVEWNFQLSWPPIKEDFIEEWWCRTCHFWRLNSAAHPKKRRKHLKND